MSEESDIVQRTRLTTTFRRDGTTLHTFVETRATDESDDDDNDSDNDDDPAHPQERRPNVVERYERKEYWKGNRRIGRGGFGRVLLQCCVKGGEYGAVRAVKILDKPQKSSLVKDLRSELEALARFSDEKYRRWFVESFGWYEDSDSVYIAMEYCQFGDLHSYLESDSVIAPHEAKQITRQILQALSHMHDIHFVHRDLKPSNILIKSRPPYSWWWWVKLADFGISKRVKSTHGPSTMKGTPEFMAPELLGLIESQRTGYTDFMASDIWAAGEIIIRLVTRRPAFNGLKELSGYCSNSSAAPSSKLGHGLDTDCGDLVDHMMAAAPAARIRAHEALEHDWLHYQSSSQDTQSSGYSYYSNTVSALSTVASQLEYVPWTVFFPSDSIPPADGVIANSEDVEDFGLPDRMSGLDCTEAASNDHDDGQDERTITVVPKDKLVNIPEVSSSQKLSPAADTTLEANARISHTNNNAESESRSAIPAQSIEPIDIRRAASELETGVDCEGGVDRNASGAAALDGSTGENAGRELAAAAPVMPLAEAAHSAEGISDCKEQAGHHSAPLPLAAGNLANGAVGPALKMPDHGSALSIEESRSLFSATSPTIAIPELSREPNLLPADAQFSKKATETRVKEPLAVLPRQRGEITSMVFSPNGQFLVITSIGGPTKLWEIDRKASKCRQRLIIDHVQAPEHENTAVFSPDSQILAIRIRGARLGLWDTCTLKCLKLIDRGVGVIKLMCMSSDNRMIAAVQERMTGVNKSQRTTVRTRYTGLSSELDVRIWEVSSGKPLVTVNLATMPPVKDFWFSRNGSQICVHQKWFWNAELWPEVVVIYNVPSGTIASRCPLPCSRWAEGRWAKRDSMVVSKDFKTVTCVDTTSPNDRTVVSSWLIQGMEAKLLQAHPYLGKLAVQISPDSRWAAILYDQQCKVLIFEVYAQANKDPSHCSRGRWLTLNRARTNLICLRPGDRITFSPDSRFVAVQSSNSYAVWDVASGMHILTATTYDEHDSPPRTVWRPMKLRFSEDGSLLVAERADTDATPTIWALETVESSETSESARRLKSKTPLIEEIELVKELIDSDQEIPTEMKRRRRRRRKDSARICNDDRDGVTD